MMIRFGKIIDNPVFDNRPGFLGQLEPREADWDTRTVGVKGSKDFATVKQARNSQVDVEFHNGKKAQTAIVTTPNARYIVLEGGRLQLPDTVVELQGDTFSGKIDQVKVPAPQEIHPQTATPQAFLLTAGVGSRFEPVSGDITDLPKPAVPLIGRESIARNIVKLLQAHGMNDVLVHTFYKRLQVHKSLAGIPTVRFMDDPEAPGSAGALYKALKANLIDTTKPVVIIAGDAVTNGDLSQLVRKHVETGAGVTIGVQEVSDEDVPNFGIIQTDNPTGKDSGEIQSFLEKPSLQQAGKNRLGSTGIYVISPEVYPTIIACGDVIFNDTSRPKKDRIYDFGMHFLPMWLQLGKFKAKQPGKSHMYAEVMPGYWNDAGNPIDYLRTVNDIARGLMGRSLASRLKRFYENGVLFWEGTKAKAKLDGAKVSGNVIVTKKP